jgi:aryl-alcohol dehydrogenase-like predicted oxidoreductase
LCFVVDAYSLDRNFEATPAQIALARLLAQGPWIVPIPALLS